MTEKSAQIKIMACLFLLAAAPYATANHVPTDSPNWQQIKGDAPGNFEFLGTLCFPQVNDGVVEFQILTKEEAPPNLAILLYDDRPNSFDMITREPPYKNSCISKSMASKPLTKSKCNPGEDCQIYNGKRVQDMSHSTFGPMNDFCPSCHLYSHKIQVVEHIPRTWYFVAAQCGGGTLKIEKYRISSPDAIECKIAGRTTNKPLSPHPNPPSPSQSHSSVPAASPVPSPAPMPAALAVSGYSYGNFEYLGDFCFSSGSTGMIYLHVDDASTFDDAHLLVYDEDGFDQLFDSRHSAYFQSEDECERRKRLARMAPISLDTTAIELQLVDPSKTLLWNQRQKLYFVIEQCTTRRPLNLKSYTIIAPEAVNCDPTVNISSTPKDTTMVSSPDQNGSSGGKAAVLAAAVCTCVLAAIAIAVIWCKRNKTTGTGTGSEFPKLNLLNKGVEDDAKRKGSDVVKGELVKTKSYTPPTGSPHHLV